MHTLQRTLSLLILVFTFALGFAADRAPRKATTHDVLLLAENFDKFVAGSEANPDSRDLCEEKRDWCIDPDLLQTPGWNGGGIYQAGGCAMIYSYYNDYDGNYYLGYLESPRFDTSDSRGEFVVCFRARSVLEQDWLGVCGVPTNHSEAKQKFAVIGNDWGYYEVTLQCGDDNTCVQFEPLSDACYIDDVRIIQVIDDNDDDGDNLLATPVTLSVDDFTPAGYTARWLPVADADDYALYDYLYYTTTSDGEAFDYVNTDFAAIIDGSVDHPVTPAGDSDFYRYLDDCVGRADWLAYMPMWADGCLALDNSYNSMMPAGLSSPAFSIAAPGSDLHVDFDVMSPSLTSMTLYVYGPKGPLGDYSTEITPDWSRAEFTIPACPDGVSFELVIDDYEAGYAFLDNLHVWQSLPAGTTAHVAAAYYETAETQQYVTITHPDDAYRHAFSVSAYKYTYDDEGDIIDYVMSRWTDPVFADGQSAEGIARVPFSLDEAPSSAFDLQGRPLSARSAARATLWKPASRGSRIVIR